MSTMLHYVPILLIRAASVRACACLQSQPAVHVWRQAPGVLHALTLRSSGLATHPLSTAYRVHLLPLQWLFSRRILLRSRRRTRPLRPSIRPSDRPSVRASVRPSVRPSVGPTVRPTVRPSDRPSVRPSVRPTRPSEIFQFVV